MRADRVEVSWDAEQSKWLVRVESGEEVIRRHYNAPKTADEERLFAAAHQTLQDEGYDTEGANIRIVR